MHRMEPDEDRGPRPEVAARAFERMLAGPVEPEVLAEAILAATPGWAGTWGAHEGPATVTDMLLGYRD